MGKNLFQAAVVLCGVGFAFPAAAQVLYSPEQYPTAQGHYLAAPPSAKPSAAPAPSSSPLFPSSSLSSSELGAETAPASDQPSAAAHTGMIQSEPVLPSQELSGSSAEQAAQYAPPPAPAPAPEQPEAQASSQPEPLPSPPEASTQSESAPAPAQSEATQAEVAQPAETTPEAAQPAVQPETASAADTQSSETQTESVTYSENEPAPRSGMSVGTRSGFTLGGQISNYRYQEHVVANTEFMHETGPKFGITGSATKVFNSGYFLSADARFAYGQNDYQGSGSESGVNDLIFDIRGLAGHDFIYDNGIWGTSPYLGFGYRNLYNDLRGTTTTGAVGYRRDSQYLYIPLGLTQRVRVNDHSRLSANLEYDYLAVGFQTTYLSDVGASDITNYQRGGYGLRGSVMYDMTHWSVGPFFNYWNINQSTTDCAGGICGYEPHNQTIEYGLQGRYHF